MIRLEDLREEKELDVGKGSEVLKFKVTLNWQLRLVGIISLIICTYLWIMP